MRSVSCTKLLAVCVLLAVTAFLIHGRSQAVTANGSGAPLRSEFERVTGWNPLGNQPLEPRVVEELRLDDYLYRSFIRDGAVVTLYIGYYHTAGKVGAAHDPLVCFNGQGWRITGRSKGQLRLTSSPGLRVNYSSMIVERDGQREQIVYWFQTNGKTAATTLTQKVHMVQDRLFGSGENNAFVRISTPVAGDSTARPLERITHFVEAFYPSFHRYAAGAGPLETR
ncbi:exosortase C-terminal domain/associated protein EpsI [Geobacter sulfurreducens]|uniref:exosortase C-terminal domain/associated protein EpsI n=1 Tax=Geobacter sulfurreducens TaxID=35554 RepID=UPI0005D965A3|nr:exosortase C-terminal domain/associated protein EpsI [Geobacter sulfurreducens]AJY68209.1 sugar ABC transporter substrate-binding protein [Geobacter sulfurreducens]UTG91435.1 EpsI family protein [Geobacter sulfurreducens]